MLAPLPGLSPDDKVVEGLTGKKPAEHVEQAVGALEDLVAKGEGEVQKLLQGMEPGELTQVKDRAAKLKEQLREAKGQAPEWLNLLESALLTERDYPAAYPPQIPVPLENPSFDLALERELIDALVSQWAGERIPFNEGFLELKNFSVRLDARNVIVMRVTEGYLKYSQVITARVKIDDATIELLPVIRKVPTKEGNTEIHLSFRGRMTGLDLKDNPGELDRVAAHVVTQLLDVPEGVGARNITKSLAKPIDMSVDSGRQVVMNPSELAAFLRDGKLILQAKFEVKKIDPPPPAKD